MSKAKYSQERFTADAKRLIDMAGGKIDYIGNDAQTYRVSFRDDVLGIQVDFFLSKMTVVIKRPSSSFPVVKRNSSWGFFEHVLNHLYNYI